MALSKEQLLQRLYRYLAKQADAGLYGQITVDFQAGYALIVRTVQSRKLEFSEEVDGVTDARLQDILNA